MEHGDTSWSDLSRQLQQQLHQLWESQESKSANRHDKATVRDLELRQTAAMQLDGGKTESGPIGALLLLPQPVPGKRERQTTDINSVHLKAPGLQRKSPASGAASQIHGDARNP